VFAPLAVSVAVPPRQIVAELTVMFSEEPIFTVAVAIPEQLPFIPVTVYDVVVDGETLIDFVVSPVLQE
jgi:hypothetical protein